MESAYAEAEKVIDFIALEVQACTCTAMGPNEEE